MPLTWDDNGNLLQDHTGTVYNYDTANRLVQVVQDGTTHTFGYSGLGDRVRQVVGGEVTVYTLDLNAGVRLLDMEKVDGDLVR